MCVFFSKSLDFLVERKLTIDNEYNDYPVTNELIAIPIISEPKQELLDVSNCMKDNEENGQTTTVVMRRCTRSKQDWRKLQVKRH